MRQVPVASLVPINLLVSPLDPDMFRHILINDPASSVF